MLEYSAKHYQIKSEKSAVRAEDAANRAEEVKTIANEAVTKLNGIDETVANAKTEITNHANTEISNASVEISNVANTYSQEIGYLSGVTSNIQTQLNNKVSSPISGLCTSNASTTSTATSSKPAVVVQNYRNGKNWYRVWSDGWIEQGGMNSKDNTTVNLLKPFQNTNYGILYALDYGTGSPAWNEYTSGKTNNNRTTTSFTTGTRVGNWYAFGY